MSKLNNATLAALAGTTTAVVEEFETANKLATGFVGAVIDFVADSELTSRPAIEAAILSATVASMLDNGIPLDTLKFAFSVEMSVAEHKRAKEEMEDITVVEDETNNDDDEDFDGLTFTDVELAEVPPATVHSHFFNRADDLLDLLGKVGDKGGAQVQFFATDADEKNILGRGTIDMSIGEATVLPAGWPNGAEHRFTFPDAKAAIEWIDARLTAIESNYAGVPADSEEGEQIVAVVTAAAARTVETMKQAAASSPGLGDVAAYEGKVGGAAPTNVRPHEFSELGFEDFMNAISKRFGSLSGTLPGRNGN